MQVTNMMRYQFNLRIDKVRTFETNQNTRKTLTLIFLIIYLLSFEF